MPLYITCGIFFCVALVRKTKSTVCACPSWLTTNGPAMPTCAGGILPGIAILTLRWPPLCKSYTRILRIPRAHLCVTISYTQQQATCYVVRKLPPRTTILGFPSYRFPHCTSSSTVPLVQSTLPLVQYRSGSRETTHKTQPWNLSRNVLTNGYMKNSTKLAFLHDG